MANDVFRIAWPRALQPGAEALPWLLVTARNLVAKEMRPLRREKELTLKLAAEHVTAGRTTDVDDTAHVHEVLDAMRPKDREVLMLAYPDDLNMAQMSALLDCSVESAKSRLFRARKAFGRLAPTTFLKGGSK